MDGTMNPEEYPLHALCPKAETGVSNFLSKNPTFDGRGAIIAIFDSGVDPGVPGLRKTTTGLTKVVERYDCSGAGDVDTSTIVNLDMENSTLKLASGKVVYIPSSWNTPEQCHVGVKPLFELYPSKVKERIEAHRKEKHWDPEFRKFVSAATRKQVVENNNKPNDQQQSLEEKCNKEEADAQVEVLNNLEKKYKDLGPLLDIVVFKDGSDWTASIIEDHDDISTWITLKEYSKTQQYAVLSKEDQVRISINVWDDGNILEIVGLCGSHGTHVASIAAGYFPENPELNGVAPGAQIASFTIGDARLNTMETGTALVRAMAHIMRNPDRYHVINMSYGEHAHWSTNGRIGHLMKEVVDKYGVTWVASAGNHGPALSTVGTPPWVTVNTIIGVGAYVSPAMMQAEYSLREKLPGMPYTWSSRGPTLDGEMGVNVCAPGGAITSVPSFTLSCAQLMNGTSMAAPHVAGCVALMLSGAKKRNLNYSPFSVKKALENSAQYLPDQEPFAQGHGLVRVEEAFSLLEEYSLSSNRDVRFLTSVTSTGLIPGWPQKGIYIRDPPFAKEKEYSVAVRPVFFKTDTIDPERKIDFRMNLCLTSKAPWVHTPKYFDLANMERSFNVKVDPEGLKPGVHYSQIEAFDRNNMTGGPVFRVHVTVVKPIVSLTSKSFRPSAEFQNVSYCPGDIKRYFIHVPKGSAWASLTLKLAQGISTSRFVIHVVSLLSGQSCTSAEYYKMISLQPMEESTVAFAVQENRVMEVVIARWWAEQNGVVSLDSNLTFRSGFTANKDWVVSVGDAYSKISVLNAFGTEEIQPTITLKNQVQLLRPSDMKLTASGTSRDIIPNNRCIYELLSTYSFSLSRASEVIISCPLLSDTLYECEYESQQWMIFDSNKRYLNSGDAYPSKWPIKLEKGDYVLKLNIRHEKREALEKFYGNGTQTGNGGSTNSGWSGDTIVPSLPVLVSTKLPSAISLDVYSNLYDLQDYKSTKKGSNNTLALKNETSTQVFVSTFIPDKSLKNLAGSSTLYLQGSFTATKDELGKKVNTVNFKLCMPEAPPKSKAPPSKDSKSKVEEMDDQLRDLAINRMMKLLPDDCKRIYEELKTKHDSHLPLHVARLNYLDSLPASAAAQPVESAEIIQEGKSQVEPAVKTKDVLLEIVSLSEKILNAVSIPSLLMFYGTKTPATNSAEATKTKQTMDKQKNAVVEAYVKKGLALYDLAVHHSEEKDKLVSQLDEILLDVSKIVELTDSRVSELVIQHAVARGHYARALKLLDKQLEAEPAKWTAEQDAKVIGMFNNLGWTMAVWYWENIATHRYPKDYRLF